MLNKFFFKFSASLFLLLLFTVLFSTDVVEANLDEKYLEVCGPACKALSAENCATDALKVNTIGGTSHHKTLCYCKWHKNEEYCVPDQAPIEKYLETCGPACKPLSQNKCAKDAFNVIDGTSYHKTLCYCQWDSDKGYCVPDLAALCRTANSDDQ
ncbi:hypothetical protein niasHT_022968 [Heterodera trifolii]|uniref:Uncharacterized protein n=1 Tax=Heterodera trifolii TaxID=157864 RepID=A0ABD2KQS2_9BILA